MERLKMKIQNKPFTQLLSNGVFKYELLYFNVKVLKDFSEDPRYHISNFDDRQNISIKTEYDSSEEINSGEKIVLDNIGFGYDENDERVIAIFLKQLASLPAEMQQIFNARRNNNDVYLDPTFIESINGIYSKDMSIFEAITYEIQKINEICESNNDGNLFEEDFKDERPELFKLILLPTKKEYTDFIQTFDKMIYDNVNKEFFKSKLDKPWKTIKPAGSKNLIEEWLKKLNVETDNIEIITTSIDDIRKERNIPSHELHKNEYDAIYYKKQTTALIEIYKALKILINILIEHYSLQEYELEKWFIEDNIRTYSKTEIKQEENKNYIFMKDLKN